MTSYNHGTLFKLCSLSRYWLHYQKNPAFSPTDPLRYCTKYFILISFASQRLDERHLHVNRRTNWYLVKSSNLPKGHKIKAETSNEPRQEDSEGFPLNPALLMPPVSSRSVTVGRYYYGLCFPLHQDTETGPQVWVRCDPKSAYFQIKDSNSPIFYFVLFCFLDWS